MWGEVLRSFGRGQDDAHSWPQIVMIIHCLVSAYGNHVEWAHMGIGSQCCFLNTASLLAELTNGVWLCRSSWDLKPVKHTEPFWFPNVCLPDGYIIPTSKVSGLVPPGQVTSSAIFFSRIVLASVVWVSWKSSSLSWPEVMSSQVFTGALMTITFDSCTWWSYIVRSVLMQTCWMISHGRGSQCCFLNPAFLLSRTSVWCLTLSQLLRCQASKKHQTIVFRTCVCPMGASSPQVMYQLTTRSR